MRSTRFLLLLVLWSFAAFGRSSDFPPDTFPPDDASKNAPKTDDGKDEEKSGDDEYLSPKKKRQDIKKKAKDSVVRQPIPDEDGGSGGFSPRYRLGALLGLSNLSTNNSNAQPYLSLGDHFLLGVNTDFQFTPLIGAGLEFFYAFTPTQNLLSVSGGSIAETMVLKELGGIAEVRFEFPIAKDNMVWRPRLGLGYGYFQSTQVVTIVSSSTTTTQNISVGGIFLSAGVEIALGAKILLFADAGLSVLGSGGLSGSASQTASSSSFSRFRLGGSVNLFGPVSIGPLVTYRVVSSNLVASTAGTNVSFIGQDEKFLQILGLVSVEL